MSTVVYAFLSVTYDAEFPIGIKSLLLMLLFLTDVACGLESFYAMICRKVHARLLRYGRLIDFYWFLNHYFYSSSLFVLFVILL